MYDNASRFKYLYYSIRYFNSKVRPISYLYRIKIGEKYLLVRSQRRTNQNSAGRFGVIKILPDGKTFLSTIKAKEDDFIPVDDNSENDLRITIDGRNIFTLMTWYETAAGRETDCWREFYEELVQRLKILSTKNFGYVFTRHLKRHVDPITFGNPEQKHRFLVSEIYELLHHRGSDRELIELRTIFSDKYVRVTEEDTIRRLGVIPKQGVNMTIPITACWTLSRFSYHNTLRIRFSWMPSSSYPLEEAEHGLTAVIVIADQKASRPVSCAWDQIEPYRYLWLVSRSSRSVQQYKTSL